MKRNCSKLIATLLAAVMVLTLAPVAPAAQAADLPAAGLNYNQYPALKDVYKDYFLMGTCKNDALLTYHFNAFTNENAMKPSNTQPTKGNFTLSSANTELNSVADKSADIRLIGHCLLWHSQSPNWMWDTPNYNRETAIANLNSHIDRVLGEFGGRLQAIDVVNEALGEGSNWKTSVANKGEGWSLALSSDFIELAFVRAAQIVDANGWDCKLTYNDFSLSGTKAQACYNMVKELNEKYAGTRPNGKQLIEVIGIQGHGNQNMDIDAIEAGIKLFATLPGVTVSITELDIEWLNTGSLTEEQAIAQGQKYAQLFQMLKKYAAGPANTTGPKVVERVTFWGTNDGSSWKSAGMPLLFNNSRGKEALIAVLYPEEYLVAHPVAAEQPDPPKKHVNGVYVYATADGDSWSGANIVLGNSASVWPWSTAGADRSVAFTPVAGAKYRIIVNVTSYGTNAIRVRWIKDQSNGNYTSADAAIVNNHTRSASQTATVIPAYFNSGMVSGGTYSLKTEITLDGSQPADGLIGNIAIRGGSGGNSFVINWITIDRIDGAEERMVTWPAPEANVTNFSIGHGTYVAGLPAGMRFNVAGELLADASLSVVLSSGTNNLTSPATVTEGTTMVQYAAMPTVPGTYTARLMLNGRVVKTADFKVEALPDDIWKPSVTMNGEGKAVIVFADAIAPVKTGYAASLNGVPVGVTQSGNTLVTDVDFAYMSRGDKFVVSGVIYTALFPSYSITFTVKVS